MKPKTPQPKISPLPRSNTIGVMMPVRENIVGIVYMKKDKIYLAERNYSDLQDDSNDHLIGSLNDIKKIFTKKKLRNGSVA